MLKIKEVCKNFGGLRAVDKCSLTVQERSITGLIGPNGAGKTTLFNVITGFLKKEGGEVWLQGEEVGNFQPYEIALKGMVRTFQTAAGFMHMTVMENMMIAPQAQEGEKLWRTFFPSKNIRIHEKEAKEKAAEILNFMGLYEKRNEYVEDLASVEIKLLEVGRQMMTGARIFLLDEPMSGVSPAFQGKMVKYIKDIRERIGLTFFIIEHNLGFIQEVSDAIYVMNNGQLLCYGTWKEIACNEKVIEAYLGGKK
jgi:ABC-type branched-subunit amino acid transport system ATPase component